jgi:phosphoglycerol transferase
MRKFMSVEAILPAGLLVLVSLVFAWSWCFGLQNNPFERLELPIIYSKGDGITVVAAIKAMMQGDWWPFTGIYFARLAAPYGLNYSDFPSSDGVFHLMFWIVSRFTSDPFTGMDAVFLLSFPLNALAMFWFLKRNSIQTPVSFFFSLLYTLLPFHFLRYNHLFYAIYFYVPFGCQYLIELSRRLQDDKGAVFRWTDVAFAGFFAACGIYQSYFLIVQIGLIFIAYVSLDKRGGSRAFNICAYVILFLVGATILALAPTWLLWWQHGRNNGIAIRYPQETETYALKIVNLFMPTRDSFFNVLAYFRSRYRSGTAVVEGFDESFGLFGFVGLTALILSFLRGSYQKKSLQYFLGFVVIALIFYTTIGGYGAIFAHLGWTFNRSIDRISIWIVCFTYLFMGLVVQRLFDQRKNTLVPWVLGFIGLFAIFEIAPNQPRFEHSGDAAGYYSDKDFFKSFESKLPPGATVLTLPFVTFPEGPAVNMMGPYDHLVAMVFTEKLKFSYGAALGRQEADRIHSLSEGSLKLEAIQAMGYSAIYIDAAAYPGGKVDLGNLSNHPFREVFWSHDHRRLALIL